MIKFREGMVGVTYLVEFVLGQSLEVTVPAQRNDGLSLSHVLAVTGDTDNAGDTSIVSVREAIRNSAGSIRISSPGFNRATLRRVEPVEVSSTSSSSVPALGAGAEDGECEVGAAASGVTLTLGTGGETVVLSGETDTGGKGPADGTTVIAEEEVTTA